MLAFVTLRMSGHYLPLATIAWGLSLYYLMSNIDALGKYDGILGIRSLSLFGFDIGQGRGFFVLTWALVLAFAVALLHLLDSRAGRAIRSLKSGAAMAESMGISTFRYKVTIFVIAALFASVAGWLFAHFQRTVNPTAFGLKMGIEYLFMTVVGGVGHVWGAITGAALTKLLDDQLQVLLPRLIGTSGSYEVIVFGIALVMMLKYQPDGLWDFVERRLPRATAPGRLGRCAGAGRERASRRPASWCWTCRRCARSSAAWSPSTTSASRSAPARSSGLIGPNGAGKTTTFNLITGVLPLTRRRRARSAAAAVSGLPARAHRALRAGAHLPARQDDPRHDGAGERGAGRAHARPQGRAGGHGAAGPRRGTHAVPGSAAPARAHRHGRAPARAGRQPGDGTAAAAGDRARAVRRPGAAAAGRAGGRACATRKSRRWSTCCASCSARA